MVGSLWPSSFATCVIGIPSAIAIDANVCLSLRDVRQPGRYRKSDDDLVFSNSLGKTFHRSFLHQGVTEA